jgi:hypothetical protein
VCAMFATVERDLDRLDVRVDTRPLPLAHQGALA